MISQLKVPTSPSDMTPELTGSAGQCAPADMIAFLAGLPLVSRPVITKWFCQNPAIETKQDSSPVTIADQSVERDLRAAIAARFPDDMIMGEEFASTGNQDSAYRWIIDPIDGTKAFISGKPAFGTLVGLLHHNLPIAGLVDMPVFGESYIGLNGFSGQSHAELNGAAIAPSGQSELGAARLATTSPRALSTERLIDFDRLADQVAVTNYGGDCHNYALLAAGHIDLVMEDSLAAHDMMAVVALMLAAGATVSDLDGQPIQLGQSTSILAAATPKLHQAALTLISARD
ncbi:histidinol phosphate phosphatase [Alphaproteobacteria bacterium]|nr:histidinol phosphate phosphatase [Alphaproteobacteria bacterium]